MTEEQKEMQVELAQEETKKAAPVATTSAEADDNFDWEAYANDDVIPASEKEELVNRYAETLSSVVEKEVVISMNKREVVVNIGYKSDGIISLNEFRYDPELKVGDKVEVYVETQEDKKGQLTLSHKKARALRSWDRVNAALENDEIIKGFVKCRTKGGMIVDVFGIEAFLPGSQIEVTHDSFMFRANSILLFDILPRVVFQLFDTQRHLSLVSIQGKNYSLYLISYFHEILSGTQML